MTDTPQQFARLWLADYQIIFKLTPAERAVYLALALYGSKDAKVTPNSVTRFCYPSQDKMAALLGCSSGTIRRGVARLKARTLDGRSLIKKDKDGKEYIEPEDQNLPRMLVVKHRMSTSSIYILSSHAELIDSSHVELIDSLHVELADSSHAELIDSSHAELADSSHAEQQIELEKKDTINKVIDDLEPLDRKFKLIFDYFSSHSLTQWKGPRELEEFRLIKDRSSLNVGMELLHIGAYQLQKIDEYDEKSNNRRFWTRRFWISGMSQWLGRKRKSTLDLKRSYYIEKLKSLIPDLEPELRVLEENAAHIPDHQMPNNQPKPKSAQSESEQLVYELLDLASDGDENWLKTLHDFSQCDEFPEHLRNQVDSLITKFKKG